MFPFYENLLQRVILEKTSSFWIWNQEGIGVEKRITQISNMIVITFQYV